MKMGSNKKLLEIDDYLAGRLSGSEEYEFEAQYFENPELLHDVELTAAMKEGLMERDRTVRKSKFQNKNAFSRFLESWFSSPTWSAVATAASAVFAVLLITQSQTYTTNVPSGLVGELSLLPTRTSEIEPPSAQLNSEGSLLISVSTLALETSKVNARVSKDNSLIFDKIPLQPDEYGVAIVLIPTEGLVAGTYTMEISDGNNVRSHAFVITR